MWKAFACCFPYNQNQVAPEPQEDTPALRISQLEAAVASLQSAVDAKGATISSQTRAIATQELVIEKQNNVISRLHNTILKQEITITQQQTEALVVNAALREISEAIPNFV